MFISRVNLSDRSSSNSANKPDARRGGKCEELEKHAMLLAGGVSPATVQAMPVQRQIIYIDHPIPSPEVIKALPKSARVVSFIAAKEELSEESVSRLRAAV